MALADYDRAVQLYNRGDFPAAFKEFLHLAEAGDNHAQQAVGLMYEKGRGVKRDFREAARWYEQAAIQGNELAAGNLGVLYRDGLGVERDYRQAMHWLKQAAMAGEPYAMHNLGALYANGQGPPADLVEGFAWITLAVEGGAEQEARADLERIGRLLSGEERRRADSRVRELAAHLGRAGQEEPAETAEQPLQPGKVSQDSLGNTDVQKSVSWTGCALDGISLRCPADWQIEQGNREGMVAIAGAGGERLVVWPIFTRGRLNATSAFRLLTTLTRLVEPGVSLPEPPQQVAPTVIRAGGGGHGRQCIGALFWVATPAGDAITYVLASADSGAFGKTLPVFAEILGSLSLRGSGRGAASGSQPAGHELSYVRFTDPTENAFTVEIPSGWRSSGGIARYNASDVRPWLRLVSPDGRVQVFMGDPRIPSMLVPNAPLAAMGFTEGMIYDAGYNQRFLLRSYHPGKEAARLYMQEQLAEGCQDGVVEDFRDRLELSATINGIFRAFRSPFAEQQLHTGEIARSCPGADLAQYVFAGTLLSRIPSPQGDFGMWVLNYLYGFQSPRADAGRALAVTRHLADSFRVTEQWAQMNGGLQSRVSDIVARTGAEIARTVSDGYWHAQRTREKGLEQYGQAIRGVEETLDTVTGERIEVVSGFEHNWIDHQGYVVGTRTETSPGIDFRQLLQVGGDERR